MKLNGVYISEKALTNIELEYYAKLLHISNFKGVYMKDEIPKKRPSNKECGIMNFNTSSQQGSHWVCWYKSGSKRLYFDSYGEHIPTELEEYLKTSQELKLQKAVIERNIVIVQHINTTECGALCLYVLYQLMNQHLSFECVINRLHTRYKK